MNRDTLWTVPHLPWTTARMDVAVTHTDHSESGNENSFKLGNRKNEVERTKSEIRDQKGLPQINPEKFQLTSDARQNLFKEVLFAHLRFLNLGGKGD